MDIKEIINNIMGDYNFIGISYDKEGEIIGNYYLYSKTIELFPSQVDVIKEILKDFSFTNLYLNWYIVGFNK